MKDLKDIVFIIQARLGSQRVPQKMIKDFSGTTLMHIALDKINSSSFIPSSQFFASVYEDELKSICVQKDSNIFSRSQESADSEGTPMSLMYEWWNKLPYKYCVLINACAPFLKTETIENFTKAYLDSKSEGMFGVMEKKNYFWNKQFDLVTPWPEGQAVMNSKFVEETYEAAHCLYAGRMDKIGEGIWMGDFNKPGDIELFPMQERECLDIDYQWQFDMCESLYNSGLR
jgi:CMP-N-acetylneuraminic acid synthetase|tara:strand:- start:353 stop:1042 length:690 start_codon:yes stop_codon:yes gene_type:complete